jgi:hypothetical protein
MKRYTISLILIFAISSTAFGKKATIDWASFPIEIEAFSETVPGNYGAAGFFAGIGMIYFSPNKKIIQFKGLRKIEIPYMGQEPDDKYELRFESFAITSIIPINEFEFTFYATKNSPFHRTLTGKIIFSISKSGLYGSIKDFEMDEHGGKLQGVMNRYYLPKSESCKSMFKKYEEVFFGGNYLALDFSN